MSQSIDFEALKRKLFLSYHQDGILDLVIGLCILGFGFSMNMESSAYIILSWLGLILYAPLKSAITIPRIGFVQFDNASKRRNRLLVMLGVALATFVLFLGLFVFLRSDNFSAGIDAWFRQYYLLVLSFFPAIIFAGAALWTGVYRLLVHALLIVGIIFAGIQLNIHEPYFVMFLGGIIFLIGLWLLIRFVRRYAVQKEEEHDVR